MYGKWVTLLDPTDMMTEVKVFVWCTPDTSEEDLQHRAMNHLLGRLKKHRAPEFNASMLAGA